MVGIYLLLPIVWAIVATVVGLILYKTSRAFIQDTSVEATGRPSKEAEFKSEKRRRIRLTGSIAIATVTFAGLWYATVNLVDSRTEQVLQEFERNAVEIDRRLLSAQAAISSGNDLTARADLEGLQQANRRSLDAVRELKRSLGR